MFCFYSKLTKAVLDPSEIEQFLTSLKVGHPFVNKHIKDVVVSGASAETMERKCFPIIYKRCVVFLMEGATTPQILFIKILNPQLLDNNFSVIVSEPFFRFKDRISINLQIPSPLSSGHLFVFTVCTYIAEIMAPPIIWVGIPVIIYCDSFNFFFRPQLNLSHCIYTERFLNHCLRSETVKFKRIWIFAVQFFDRCRVSI